MRFRIWWLLYQMYVNLNLRRNHRNLSMKSSRLVAFICSQMTYLIDWSTIKVIRICMEECVIVFSLFEVLNLSASEVLNLFTILSSEICFSGPGEPGSTDQVYITKFGILRRQTSCCLHHLQMSSSLEVI